MSPGSRKIICILTAAILAVFLFANPVIAKRGCCSWHGGVCGCDTSVGRQVCCDGTYSPTCTCAYIPPATATPTPKPTATSTPIPTFTPTPTPTSIPKQKPSPVEEITSTPEVKGATTQETEPLSDAEVIGFLGAIGVLVGGLGWGAYRLLKKFIPKKPFKA